MVKRKQNLFKRFKLKMIIPDKKGNWLNQTNNDWEELLPLGTKECKLGKTENAIFKLFSCAIESKISNILSIFFLICNIEF